MKKLIIICLSLSVLTGRLELNNCKAQAKTPAALQLYLIKKTKKEALRDGVYINPLRKVIGNSLHFIWRGLDSKGFPF